MGTTLPNPPRKGTKPLSVIISALLVPLSAVAAFALTGNDTESKTDTAAGLAVTTAVVATTPIEMDLETDLTNACGPSGTRLVEAETNGTITDIQLAALTALRDICRAQGLPLPPGIEPPNGAALTVQNSNPPPQPPTTVSASRDDDHDDYEEDHHDDHDDDHEEND